MLFLPERIRPEKITDASFSSRKIPEFMNYRLVRCRSCDVVYTSDPLSEQVLERLYHQAAYDSAEEAEDAARSYAEALAPFFVLLSNKVDSLEIGTGTGAFLEKLREFGFEHLVGVEPSTAAIDAAPEHRRLWIREGMFDVNAFEADSFDLVCCFMTMEHVREPQGLAREVRSILRHGGAFVTVTHDYRSPINRLLGRFSPIIDVEHMQIFSTAGIRKLLELSGFRIASVSRLRNEYSVTYWLRLMPLPLIAKASIEWALRLLRLDNVRIKIDVGNVLTIGIKP